MLNKSYEQITMAVAPPTMESPRRPNAFNDPDGMYTVTRFGDSQQVHLVKQPMGMREQLTFLSEPVSSVSPTPMASPFQGFVYGQDSGGNENTQYFYYDLPSRKSVLITDGTSKNMSGEWSSCGEFFVFSSNMRDSVHFEVYAVNLRDLFLTAEQGKDYLPMRIFTLGNVSGYMVVHEFKKTGGTLRTALRPAVSHRKGASSATLYYVQFDYRAGVLGDKLSEKKLVLRCRATRKLTCRFAPARVLSATTASCTPLTRTPHSKLCGSTTSKRTNTSQFCSTTCSLRLETGVT